jgi:circadian clock protein KaiB
MNTENSTSVTNEKKEITKFIFQLFVNNNSAVSLRAIVNVKAILQKNYKDNYILDVIDIYENPGLTITEEVLAVPLLIKKFPLPEIRMIGDFSDTKKVLHEFLFDI